MGCRPRAQGLQTVFRARFRVMTMIPPYRRQSFSGPANACLETEQKLGLGGGGGQVWYLETCLAPRRVARLSDGFEIIPAFSRIPARWASRMLRRASLGLGWGAWALGSLGLPPCAGGKLWGVVCMSVCGRQAVGGVKHHHKVRDRERAGFTDRKRRECVTADIPFIPDHGALAGRRG